MNQPTKNKGGRPKGSKSRPKWLLQELKAQKSKRKPGRPPGSKNKPKTLEAWIESQLAAPKPKPKPQPVKPKGKPPAFYQNLSTEERSALGRKAKAAQVAQGKQGARKHRCPSGWTNRQYLLFLEDAKSETKRIFKIMEKQGLTPEDKMARDALNVAFEMIAEPLSARDRLAAVRTVLDFTKMKPATKTDLTIKTAEDFLDELAASEDGNTSD
jgi:hypothetical protein